MITESEEGFQHKDCLLKDMNQKEYIIALEQNPSDEDEQILLNGVNEAAFKMKDIYPIEYYALFLKNSKKQIYGGVSIIFFYGCVFFDLLWVSTDLRNLGWGSELVKKALHFAKEKGCSFATVHTMNWQAVSFYQKLGFKVEFVSKGYQQDSELYILRKEFAD